MTILRRQPLIERCLEACVSGRCSRPMVSLLIGLGTAVLSLAACAVTYEVTGTAPDDPEGAVLAYGLPFLVPLAMAPFVVSQLLRVAFRLHERTLQLEEEIARRRHAEEQLAVLATTDDLTGVLNRRAFFAHAAEFAASKGGPATVALLDLDDFKRLNDTHGHSAGDDALRHCGEALSEVRGAEIVVGRLGGEEFGIIVPGRTPDAAVLTLEGLRRRIAELREGLTASIGASEWMPDEAIDAALARADGALYRAKQHGRNRIEIVRREDPGSDVPSELSPVARR